MKALNWIAWISAGIGGAFLLSGIVQGFFGRWISGAEIINYFHAANSFFLVTILLFVHHCRCELKK